MNPTTAILAALAALAGITLTAHRYTILTAERHHHMTQAAIDALVAQLAKARDEIVTKLEQATTNVEAQLVEAGVAEQVDLSALTAIAQALDDIVPDTEDNSGLDETTDQAVDEPVEVDEEETDTDEATDDDVVDEDEVTDEAETDEADADEDNTK